MMMLALAWKNVWRNKKRSLIIVAATAIGLTAGLFYAGFVTAMYAAIIDSGINREFGNIQIHTSAYKSDRLIHQFLPDLPVVLHTIQADSNVRSFATHSIIEGMASSATTASGVAIVGVNPEQEQQVTAIARSLVGGAYLDRTNSIIVGKKLSEKLKLRLRSRVVLSFAGMDGNIIYGAFRVTGIFKTDGSNFDGATVFIRQDDLKPLLGTADVPIHEIVVRTHSEEILDRTKVKLQNAMPDGVVVETWRELAPELKLTGDSVDIVNTVMLGIILFALLFGLINTLLMSVLDRVRDFGVLLAVGMYRRRLFLMIILESLLLSFTGGFAGVVLGWGITEFFGRFGLDLSAFSAGLSSFGIPSLVYPYINPSTYGTLAIMMVITSIIAALYPAIKAVRLRPVEAIRTIA